ncbi:MAG: hypothetical protein ABIE55_00820 [Candidatus Aenigmatarchaeota archaeon]
MEIMAGKKFNEKLIKRYDNHPLGWGYFYGKDKNGCYNIIMANKILEEQFWLKFTSPHGYDHICVGVRAGFNDKELSLLNDSFFDEEFGIRPLNLTEKEIKDLLNKRGYAISRLKEEEERAKKAHPVSYDEADTEMMMVGPFTGFDIIDLEDISPSQMELNIKLEDELKRLGKKYLNYIS